METINYNYITNLPKSIIQMENYSNTFNQKKQELFEL